MEGRFTLGKIHLGGLLLEEPIQFFITVGLPIYPLWVLIRGDLAA